MLPCPCGQKGPSISTGRFPVDASTVRLLRVVFESRATMVRGMRCHRFPQISHRSLVHHSVASLLDRTRWVVAVVRRLLPRRLALGKALPRTHWASKRFATLLFLSFMSRCSRRRNASWMSSDRPMGINIMPRIDRHVIPCDSFIVVLTQFRYFWMLSAIRIKLVGTMALQIDGRSLCHRRHPDPGQPKGSSLPPARMEGHPAPRQ